jgi:hypothetical protein
LAARPSAAEAFSGVALLSVVLVLQIRPRPEGAAEDAPATA